MNKKDSYIDDGWVPREDDFRRVRALLDEFRLVALLGSWQAGKTTLARQIADAEKEGAAWFDLEDLEGLERLEDPVLALRDLRSLVVLDEIQRLPDVLPLLRDLANRPGTPTRFLVLASASTELLRQTSEPLPRRLAFHQLGGFGLDEVADFERVWLRGGLPRSYLATSSDDAARWRKDFIHEFLSQFVPDFGTAIPMATLRRFWTRVARSHGQVWNDEEFARALGVSQTAIRRYLDVFSSLFVVRQLQPWFEAINTKQVRSPKVYVADSGLLHALLGLWSRKRILSHPRAGASWEGFVIGQIMHLMRANQEQCFHWATYGGASLDLLVTQGGRRYGFYVQRSETPRLTRPMKSVMRTLKLDSLDIVHAGAGCYPLAGRVRAVPASELGSQLPTPAGL